MQLMKLQWVIIPSLEMRFVLEDRAMKQESILLRQIHTKSCLK